MAIKSAIVALALNAILGAEAPKAIPVNAEHTSGFNQFWLYTVVSIEQETGTKRVPQGTGFLVTFDDQTILVTARHVIASGGDEVLPRLVFIRSDIDGELTAAGPWVVSRSNLDLACVPIKRPPNAQSLLSIQPDLFLSRSIVEVGAPVVVVGYPAGLRSQEPFFKEPIVRSGIVSRVSGDGITLDSQVFPGNSGGPVFYVPTIKVAAPFSSPLVGSEKLVGMILSSDHVPDRPGSPPVYLGLAGMVPAETIREFLENRVRPTLPHGHAHQ